MFLPLHLFQSQGTPIRVHLFEFYSVFVAFCGNQWNKGVRDGTADMDEENMVLSMRWTGFYQVQKGLLVHNDE